MRIVLFGVSVGNPMKILRFICLALLVINRAWGASAPHVDDASNKLKTDDAHLPNPGYPFAAWQKHEQGTVVLWITYDNDGSVASAKVDKSSGVDLLDSWTVAFVTSHWSSPRMRNQKGWAKFSYVVAPS